VEKKKVQMHGFLPDRSLAKAASKVQRFVSDYLAKSDAKGGLVIGLSGGLDSAVCLELCTRAVGSKKVLGLILPTKSSPPNDASDAAAHTKKLGVECITIDITLVLESYSKLLPSASDKIMGNLAARTRMAILYHYAAIRGGLVVGTSDRSEILVGYYTKWGDGGSDLMPIAGLYKTEVRELARHHLGIPPEIAEKKSSPRLWPEQLAEDELGIDYATLDKILHLRIDKKVGVREAARRLGVAPEQVRKVDLMVKSSEHKRAMPPAPSL
jgi:NAD+ synthase